VLSSKQSIGNKNYKTWTLKATRLKISYFSMCVSHRLKGLTIWKQF